jgi:hypothetical protein
MTGSKSTLMTVAALTTILVTAASARAQTISKVALQDLSFITGKWQGTLGSTMIEEHWTAPAGDNMLGMFRMVRDGKASLYELNVIEQTAEGPVLRLKHFRPGLVPREEKVEEVTFTLVDCAKDKATFEAMDKHLKLSFQRVSANELTISLDRAAPGGKRSTTDFKFKLTQ